ncbi:MAG TPA: hypothetical protein VHA37_02215 [Candidatus Saccharimonadales bacterium]|nr:hypothetical protein [Candidatus Saccharimonadales bacterium]
MKLLYAVFFGAGVAGFAYSRMGRRVGYGNQTNVWTMVGVVFVLVTIIFYTILSFFIPSE